MLAAEPIEEPIEIDLAVEEPQVGVVRRVEVKEVALRGPDLRIVPNEEPHVTGIEQPMPVFQYRSDSLWLDLVHSPAETDVEPASAIEADEATATGAEEEKELARIAGEIEGLTDGVVVRLPLGSKRSPHDLIGVEQPPWLVLDELPEIDARCADVAALDLCGMDSSNVSRIRSKMEKNGEAQAAEVTTGLDGRIRQKALRSERPKPAPRKMPQHPSNAECLQLVHLPQGSICSQANPVAKTSTMELLPLHSAANHPADQRVVLNQAATRELPTDAEQGRLEFSSLNLTFIKTTTAHDGRWEWIGKDDQGNHYVENCRRVQEVRKAG
jgi:hypothetical protein